MFSPRLLQNADVPVYKLLQYEGEYVVTFPRAFHGGFSLGPNVGEAVNFATHDWIAYGSDANERYRSYARPAVFSHDRLTFTMANHLQEQKAYSTCKLLLDEISRVVGEELRLREKLLEAGVRDVSHQIVLPRNRLDRLDEESAEYDDKRLCHACKHVCFFSAVACECSQSKVSCLRHSHYMCRCLTKRKYLMVWSDTNELKSTLKRVRDHCELLKGLERAASPPSSSENTKKKKRDVAPGVEKDLALHKDEEINCEPVAEDPEHVVRLDSGYHAASIAGKRTKMCMGGHGYDDPRIRGPTSGLETSGTMVRRVSDGAAPAGAVFDDAVEDAGVKAPPSGQFSILDT